MGNVWDDQHCRQLIKMRSLRPFLSHSLETKHIHAFNLIWGGDLVEEGSEAAPGFHGKECEGMDEGGT